MFVCFTCALYFFSVSRSCLSNLILHAMSTAISTVKKMQTADKNATTGKLATSGQLLMNPTTDSEVEVDLSVALVMEVVVDSVGLVLGTVNGVNNIIIMDENLVIMHTL